jgi:hypothetical protein
MMMMMIINKSVNNRLIALQLSIFNLYFLFLLLI